MTHKFKYVEVESPSGECCIFRYRYVERKNLEVLNKTIKRLQSKAGSCRYFVVEGERSSGYLNQSYPLIGEDVYNELGRKEISYADLLKLFQK